MTATWVPLECTLPTRERPLRIAEFDGLLATTVRTQQRVSPTVLRWELDPAGEAVVRELAARESRCCSFFTFTFTSHPDGLRLDIAVPVGQTAVLDALAARAGS
ncbi:MAG TPA: hypothetical protein VI357_16550 [Mycobacteriales bacterium]